MADHPDGGSCLLCAFIREELFKETIASEVTHLVYGAKQALKLDQDQQWMRLCVGCALFVHGWGISHSPQAGRLVVPPGPSGVPILRKN